MTRDEFLRTLRWSVIPPTAFTDGKVRVVGQFNGREITSAYEVDAELLSTVRHKEIWIADRLAFVQEVALAKAGFGSDA